MNVSIHAPTRGATFIRLNLLERHTVSIHAPTRGATIFIFGDMDKLLFQSTHPHGVRRRIINLKIINHGVSIHAPTRGATSPSTVAAIILSEFQSTHPHGVRRFVRERGWLRLLRFQSTHPHGVRHSNKVKVANVDLVSIHAPTRGATAYWRGAMSCA